MRMPTTLVAICAASSLLIPPATAQVSAPAANPPSRGSGTTQLEQRGTISVSNSPGAVTAQTLNVQTMEIYQEARHDPVTRQFVSGLRSYVQLMIDRTQQLDQQPYYIFALDDGRGKADDTGNIYMFLATN